MTTPTNVREEYCPCCEQLTQHAVTIEVMQEGVAGTQNVKYSREPYRMTSCQGCGTEQNQRMNKG